MEGRGYWGESVTGTERKGAPSGHPGGDARALAWTGTEVQPCLFPKQGQRPIPQPFASSFPSPASYPPALDRHESGPLAPEETEASGENHSPATLCMMTLGMFWTFCNPSKGPEELRASAQRPDLHPGGWPVSFLAASAWPHTLTYTLTCMNGSVFTGICSNVER